jgi:hypothetical protein
MTQRNYISVYSFLGEKVKQTACSNPNRAHREAYFHLLQNDYGATEVHIFERHTGVDYGVLRRPIVGEIYTEYEYNPDGFKPMRLSAAAVLEKVK